MQKLLPLFFQPQQFHVDALLVPAQCDANFLCRFSAAFFLPAGAQSDGHAAQKNIAQRDGKFVRHGFHGFRHQVAAMLAERLAQANMAVYFAAIKPGDKILTMNLAHGGHLTHGHPANFSGKFYQVTHYGVDEKTETIDYDALQKQAEEVRPVMITAGASAYPRTINFPRLRQIADSVDAILFIDMAHISGLVAGGQHPSPIPHAQFVTTTTHKSLRGPRGGIVLCKREFAKQIDATVFPGVQGGPLMHVIAAKAVCFHEALQPSFRDYQRQVVINAKALAAGLANHGYRIVSGGTDNHLMLVDLRPKDLNGKEAQEVLDRAGITVNKNAIPFDTSSPFKPGGIRVGTPAVTTRGMKEEEMLEIAELAAEALDKRTDDGAIENVRKKVIDLTSRFPLPI